MKDFTVGQSVAYYPSQSSEKGRRVEKIENVTPKYYIVKGLKFDKSTGLLKGSAHHPEAAKIEGIPNQKSENEIQEEYKKYLAEKEIREQGLIEENLLEEVV